MFFKWENCASRQKRQMYFCNIISATFLVVLSCQKEFDWNVDTFYILDFLRVLASRNLSNNIYDLLLYLFKNMMCWPYSRTTNYFLISFFWSLTMRLKICMEYVTNKSGTSTWSDLRFRSDDFVCWFLAKPW